MFRRVFFGEGKGSDKPGRAARRLRSTIDDNDDRLARALEPSLQARVERGKEAAARYPRRLHVFFGLYTERKAPIEAETLELQEMFEESAFLVEGNLASAFLDIAEEAAQVEKRSP
jgi:hypothetical protein